MISLNTNKLLAKAAENWPAKVLSIALALVLFLFHRLTTLEERFFSVPLKVEVDGSLIPSSAYTRMIRVSVRGETSSVRSLVEDDIEAFVDMRGKTKGAYRVPVQVRKKDTALGPEPLEITVDPPEISLSLDEKISKYVPLKPAIGGALSSDYQLGSYTLSPDQVMIEGPKELINGISELSTDTISLDDKKGDFSVMVGIINPDPLIKIQGNGMAEFQVFIRNVIDVKNFSGLPITFKGLDRRFSVVLEPKTGMVRLEGPDLASYTPPASLLSVDCSSIHEPGSFHLPVLANLAPGFHLVRQEPEEVELQISASAEVPGNDGTANEGADTGQ
jgi:hypothetical protein